MNGEVKIIISEIESRIEKASRRLRKHQSNILISRLRTHQVTAIREGILQERETICELKDLRGWILRTVLKNS